MLEQANQELERKVAARTADLSEAVAGLQRRSPNASAPNRPLRAAQDRTGPGRQAGRARPDGDRYHP